MRQLRIVTGTTLLKVLLPPAFVCMWIFALWGDVNAAAWKSWTRAPGVHPTNLTAEETLRRVSDLLEANDIDELMKSFTPTNRYNEFFREGQFTGQSRSRLASFFRDATLVKSGWWEEAHGGVMDEYRLFRGVLLTPKGERRESKIHMVRVNECSESVMMKIHDPGEWIIFDWLEELLDPDTSRDVSFRSELPEGYQCPLSKAPHNHESTK